MSYTMTIESPEKAAWFDERYAKLSQEQLGALFVSFLRQQSPVIFRDQGESKSVKANEFMALCRELPPSGLPKGYVFSRDEALERESRCLT